MAISASAVTFVEDVLVVSLNDGRTVTAPLERVPGPRWLADATPEQRERWSLEPGGFAIYWEDLDDGFEVEHLLSTQALASRRWLEREGVAGA
jgi:hypothetical protein